MEYSEHHFKVPTKANIEKKNLNLKQQWMHAGLWSHSQCWFYFAINCWLVHYPANTAIYYRFF